MQKNQSALKIPSENTTEAYLGSLPELKLYISKLLPYAKKTGEIDDIAQEVFVRAYTAKKNQKLENARGFLFKIARNLAFNLTAKRQKFVEETVEDFVLDGVICNSPKVEDRIFEKQRLQALTEAAASLSPKCREVFFLRHFEGLSHKEIAQKKGISSSTVEKHLARALFITSRAMRRPELTASVNDGNMPKPQSMP